MARTDTIYALASAKGRSGVCVVRLSGARAFEIAAALTRQPLPAPRVAGFRRFFDPLSGDLIDEGLLIAFAGPHSFTGENVIELHLHGSSSVLQDMFSVLNGFADTRVAHAGEFTQRAFINQKLSLNEVEGLAHLIDAETSLQRKMALRHYTGEASKIIEDWREKLLMARAYLEASIDFTDEGDVPEAIYQQSFDLIQELYVILLHEKSRFSGVERIRDGYRVVIAGAPNAGKSSLFNALVNRQAAIVSDIAGTTRDMLEIHLDIGGLPVTVVDTAGVRESDDEIEIEGVRRAMAAFEEADLVLWLSDRGFDRDFYAKTNEKTVIWKVSTKSDLAIYVDSDAKFSISTQNLSSIEGLLKALGEHFAYDVDEHMSAAVLTQRQRRAFDAVLVELEAFLNNFHSQPIEIVVENLRVATDHLSFIIGRVGVEDVLGGIFAKFCVGK